MFSLISTIQQCTNERDALLAIFNADGGNFWVGANLWATNAPVCAWQGVTCNQNGNVIELNLTGFNVTGQLPDDIQCLPFLKALALSNNSMVTTIPPAICNLQNLQYFTGNNVTFVGALPQCICTMSNLLYLYLDTNAITGTIPQCIGQMTFLHELHLACNQLTGSLPAGIFTLPFLTEVHVNCNTGFSCTTAITPNFIFLCGNVQC